MHADIDLALRALLLGDAPPVAALATLHRGEPATSMVPYALMPDSGDILLHISRLATHTQDLENDPRASLLVIAPPTAADTPLALPRVSLQGEARRCPIDDPDHETARAAYLGRLPDAEPLFDFADFSLWRLRPRFLRLVAGFGRAHTVQAEDYRRWVAQALPESPQP